MLNIKNDKSRIQLPVGRPSHIPIPARRGPSASYHPAQDVHSDWQDLHDDENEVPYSSSAASSSMFLKGSQQLNGHFKPRSALGAMTNRNGAHDHGDRTTSLTYILKASTPSTRTRRSIVKGRVSAERPFTVKRMPQSRPTARRTGPTSDLSQEIQEGGGRIGAIETQIASMQNLFDLERKRTEQLITKEKRERREQEDKVRQLEEDLLEQRRIAVQSSNRLQQSLAEEEIEQLLRVHQREKRDLVEQLEHEKMIVGSLKGVLEKQATAHLTADSTIAALKNQIETLHDTIAKIEAEKTDIAQERDAVFDRIEDLETNLQEAETLRRKLHNEVQELRGNIRVFVRVRPFREEDDHNGAATLANMRFPDDVECSKIEIATSGESAMGTAKMSRHDFSFDRVFQPDTSQAEVFAEVEHLIQSVLDGYNTCIFAYGQTGSGKTYTLEGAGISGPDAGDDEEGLIPRAVTMLWKTAQKLQAKGWQYTFEGQMLEIYNECVNDLLGRTEVDKAKHEIRHENGRTIVSNVVNVAIQTPAQLYSLLARAKKRRQVAATLMNERSSRSHCVFTLRVIGHNIETLESSDAVLNLVDLAGSERLETSGSGKDASRLKEAQSINRSLSSLGDVIMALGATKSKQQQQGSAQAVAGAHIPYRNSVLTWLLKNSLGGNSKTLMLLTLSPLLQHEKESLSSLRFASKVNSTIVGTAKRVKAAS